MGGCCCLNCWCSFNLLSRGLDVDDFTLRAHGTSVVVANRGRGTLLLFPSHFYSIVGTTPARIALLGVSGLRARSSRRNWNVEMQACLWSGCGQLFPTVSDVTSHVNESHIASQSKDTGFRCLWLGCPRTKAFVRDWVLRDHIRAQHTKDKPFECNLSGCEWRFPTVRQLRFHQKSVHLKSGRKKWNPDLSYNPVTRCSWTSCAKDFPTDEDLVNHLRKEHVAEQKPYKKFWCKWNGCSEEKLFEWPRDLGTLCMFCSCHFVFFFLPCYVL